MWSVLVSCQWVFIFVFSIPSPILSFLTKIPSTWWFVKTSSNAMLSSVYDLTEQSLSQNGNKNFFMEIRSRKIFRGWALLVTGKVYMVWREINNKKFPHTSFIFPAKTNDGVPEWTLPAQMCEWGKFDFSSCSWLLGQTIWRTYDSLLLFLRCYPWQQVGKESIPHRLSLIQPSRGADWSSWHKKRLWPTPPMKCTPITQWKQEEEQMEGLPLPHTSKCNLYLFPFLVLTPSPVGCCLATLPPCSTAALHFFSPPSAPTAVLGLGRGVTVCAPSSLQAERLPLLQHSEIGRSCARRKMRV